MLVLGSTLLGPTDLDELRVVAPKSWILADGPLRLGIASAPGGQLARIVLRHVNHLGVRLGCFVAGDCSQDRQFHEHSGEEDDCVVFTLSKCRLGDLPQLSVATLQSSLCVCDGIHGEHATTKIHRSQYLSLIHILTLPTNREV